MSVTGETSGEVAGSSQVMGIRVMDVKHAPGMGTVVSLIGGEC